MSRISSFIVVALTRLFVANVSASPVINEIMYHSAAVPENNAQEWIELYNPDALAVDVSGWKLKKGVDFTFPNGTTLGAGGYLVVAANVAAFNAAHAGFTGQLAGGWTGKLGNSGDTVRLDDPSGVTIDEVIYASEGDWGVRARGVVSFGHQGWVWTNAADGGGSSLELRNRMLAGL